MAQDKKTPSIVSQGAVMRRVLQYIGPHVSLVVLSLALCLISVALTLYVPILVGRAVDCIVGPNAVDFAALTPILMTIAVCIVITAAAQWVMNALHNSITYDTVRDIRRDAFAHIQNLPLSYLDAHPTGDTVSRMIADVDTFADGLLMGFTQLFSGIMTILGTLGFMLTLNAPITLLVVLTLCACGDKAQDGSDGENAAVAWDTLSFDKTMPLDYATQFSVSFAGDDYKRITIGQDQEFLLVTEGAAVPGGVPEGVTVLQQPLDEIYLVASAAMDSFAQLDAVDSIRFSGRKESDWYIEQAKEAMSAGDMLYAGKYSEPDYELILSQGCDLVLENTMIYHSPEVIEQFETLGIPVLVEMSSYESEPFGRMEWVKLYGALIGKENEAAALFEEKMDSVSGILGAAPTGKTVTFFYVTSNGAVNVRKSTDYVAKSIAMAGGEYVSFDNTEEENAQSTVTIQMEAFYSGAHDADVLIYNSIIDGGLTTIDELLALEPLLGDFKAVQNGNVWCLTKDFYQESLELSDLVVDLHTVLSGADTPLRFLTKLQ